MPLGLRSRLELLLTAGSSLVAAVAATVVLMQGCAMRTDHSANLIEGIVWQPDWQTVDIDGRWNEIGARRTLVQWMVVSGVALVPGTRFPAVPRLPDWKRIAGEPWAREVILGLASRHSEPEARGDLKALVALSAELAAMPTPLNVVGWYFPVESDPTWKGVDELAARLVALPRPLWISIYENSGTSPEALADWTLSWLPDGVGVFFQDGVGVGSRDAASARRYADVLRRRLGDDRFRLIAEAFRIQAGGGFRAATHAELAPQLAAYRGHSVYLFDGPHYVSDALVDRLKAVEAVRQ